MRIALVTNVPNENVLAILDALGLEGIFEPVILGEELDTGEPDPAPYEAALEAIGISKEEVVAFEDSPSGLASGIPTVGIASTHEKEKFEGLGVDLVVHDFTDPKLEVLLERRQDT
jgi:beta-phosphoglucomutase-like phosphatase (HAD superfamily)